MSETDPFITHKPLAEAVLVAIEGHAMANSVPLEDLKDIAREAILEDRIGDVAWLDQAFADLEKRQERQETEEDLQKIIPAEVRQASTREELEPILRDHERWMASVLNPNTSDAIGRANLRGSILSGLNLQDIDLRAADLREVDFSKSDLRGVNFSRARLEGANFTEANLDGASLRGAYLLGATFKNCSDENVDWRDAARG